MESEISAKPKQDPRALRARAIIFVLMAVFIVAPFIIWLLIGGGAKASR